MNSESFTDEYVRGLSHTTPSPRVRELCARWLQTNDSVGLEIIEGKIASLERIRAAFSGGF